MGLWSFWSFSFLALLYPFHLKFGAQAEISSPRANDRFYRLEVTPLEARATRKSTAVKVDNSAKVLSAFESQAGDALEPNNGKQVGNETQGGIEALIGDKTAPNCPKIAGKKCGNTSEDNQSQHTAIKMLENTFLDTRKKVKRSVGSSYAENVDRSINGERFMEAVQGVSNSRPEYRRTGEDARGSNPRQSEPHLDTSTFALSGDSAHNQAMVHWSGHNSSVILILTKLYDFNLGAVTESSLWSLYPLEQSSPVHQIC